MRWFYYALQIAVFAGLIWLNEAMKADGEPGLPLGGLFIIWIGVAAIATAIVYWSLEGLKKLFIPKYRIRPLVDEHGSRPLTLRDRLRTDEPGQELLAPRRRDDPG